LCGGPMSDFDLTQYSGDINNVRKLARRSAHAQRARLMLVAAGLTTLGLLTVAGTLLASV